MNPKRILVINGHPDPDRNRFVHALLQAYADGARSAGHEVRGVSIGELQFRLLTSAQEFESGKPPETIEALQESVRWADHLVLGFPLWLGSAPALLKGLLEQLMRPGFAFDYGTGRLPRKLLAGRSARMVVTMGMPAMVFRLLYQAHGTRFIGRNILAFCGIHPVRTTLIGGMGGLPDARRGRWLRQMERLGSRAI